MALGEAQHADAPPGLALQTGTLAKEALKEVNVSSICLDVNQRTDQLLQEKMDQILVSAEDQLTKSFAPQQEQMRAELESCREQVKSLEADKADMQRSVMMLQEQLASLTTQMMMSGHQVGWPTHGATPGGGSFVNAGMMGAFSTFPAGMPHFPNIPFFPGTAEADGQASEPSTMAPPSPMPSPKLLPSAPPTPSYPTSSIDSWPMQPPPGLPLSVRASPAPSPFGTPLMAPSTPLMHVLPPPGLEDTDIAFEMLDELMPTDASMKGRISLSDAIDAKPEPSPQSKPKTVEEKARQRLEENERQALRFMMSNKDNDDNFNTFLSPKQGPAPSPSRFLSPKANEFLPPSQFASPKGGRVTDSGLGGTPSRTFAQGLMCSPKQARTPKRQFGTPGMRSPTLAASPFVICEGGGTVFGFTIRKADDCTLGVDFKDSECGSCLQVTAIKIGGAMQAWNKLCAGGPAAGKAVLVGDKLVKVNEVTTPKDMLRECREQKLLKITVQRGEVEDDVDPVSIGSSGSNR